MNGLSITRLSKLALMAGTLVLILPSTSRAGEYWLSVDSVVTPPVATTQKGIVIGDGTFTQNLQVDINGTPITFNNPPLTVIRLDVKMCKPGTQISKSPPVYQLEWLDQGNAAVGFSGTLTTDIYDLVLSFASSPVPTTLPCTENSVNYNPTRTAVIKIGGSVFATTTYHFANVATSTVPEPGTVLLMLTGLLVLGWMSIRRPRPPRGVSA
jgi:hypothetical protein